MLVCWKVLQSVETTAEDKVTGNYCFWLQRAYHHVEWPNPPGSGQVHLSRRTLSRAVQIDDDTNAKIAKANVDFGIRRAYVWGKRRQSANKT